MRQTDHHADLNRLEDDGIPLVVWGAQLAGTHYCVVGSDNLTGGYLATSHLLASGARRIVFLGDALYPEGKLRHEGYVKALRQHGLKPEKRLLRHCQLTAMHIEEAIHQLLVEGVPFDGIFATSDVGAIRAISTLSSHNVKVPAQVRVVGYDNIPVAAHVHPSLTSINQPIDLAAVAMVDLLQEKLGGGASRSIVLPTALIERKSSR